MSIGSRITLIVLSVASIASTTLANAAPSAAVDQVAEITEALTNEYRAARGLQPVELDPALSEIAFHQATAMAHSDDMDQSIIGNFADRMAAANVGNVYGGENVGRNIATPEKMFAWWVGYSNTEQNISNPHVSKIGLALAYSQTGKPYWDMIVSQ